MSDSLRHKKPKKLVWTKKPPKHEGLYHVRTWSNAKDKWIASVAKVVTIENHLYALIAGESGKSLVKFSPKPREWAGPIPQPSQSQIS